MKQKKLPHELTYEKLKDEIKKKQKNIIIMKNEMK